MEPSSPEEMTRQNLLDRLLNCVKQVQVHFGANQEIATESDTRVSTLCIEWEMVLSHAARKPKPKNALRFTGRSEGVSLWPLAKLCVSAEDLQRFSRLSHVTSELGRGRAWLRAAINERTLENYLHGILAHEEQLRKCYEADAFLLDQERSSMLPIIAAGLSSIIFSITTDAPYLNTQSRSIQVPTTTTTPPPVHVTTHPSLPTITATTTATLHHTTSYGSLATTTGNHTPTLSNDRFGGEKEEDEDDDVIAISAKGPRKKKKKSKSKSPQARHQLPPPPPPSSAPLSDLPGAAEPSYVMIETPEEKRLQESHSSSSSHLSLDSFNEERQAPLYVALTPSPPPPPPPGGISSEAVAAASATALVLSATALPLGRQNMVDREKREEREEEEGEWESGVPLFKGLDVDDHKASQDDTMRTAIVALSRMKDELQSRNSELMKNASELEMTCQELEKSLLESKQEVDEIRESYMGQKQGLERENDLLREQLKKYVNMVQAQKRENNVQKSESLTSTSSGDVAEGMTSSMEQDKSALREQALMSERKFQEVADMYGELMEHNERLHRNLADKETTISLLVRSLRDASIELPVSQEQLPATATDMRMLVNVWIPSVIKKGRGPEAFHVYQVFVCVKAVEWNIYRRYTEFRDFHLQLQKYLPEVSSFNFPPKKAIGNKSSQVVEERRLRLQQYIRDVIKVCTTHLSKGQGTETIISPTISKQSFVTMFPFFKEDFNMDPPTLQSPSYSGL